MNTIASIEWDTTKAVNSIIGTLREKLELVGSFVEGEAVKNLEANGNIDSGNMVNSVTHAVAISEPSVFIGTNNEAAPFIEFGTGDYAENGNGRKGGWVYFYSGKKGRQGFRFTRGIRPQSFLRKALYEYKEKILSFFNE